MPTPPVLGNFPAPSPQAAVFGALALILRSDPVLHGLTYTPPGGSEAPRPVTIRAWEGDAEELAIPAPSELPLVRLTPAGGPSDWVREGQHRMVLGVRFDVFTPGTHRDDLLNLAWYSYAAIFPTDPGRLDAVRAILAGAAAGQNVELTRITVADLAAQPIREGDGGAYLEGVGANMYGLHAAGLLNATLYVPTMWAG